MPSDIATHDTQEGTEGGKKRRMQRLQGTTTVTNGNDHEADGSSLRHISAAARSDKHRVRPRTDHFKRLLKKACPSHAYLIRHKLKDCDMMRSFMTS
jgi:hypothetical protein